MGGVFKALLDGHGTVKVDGWAYIVEMKEQGVALRFYETASYEMVRCVILLEYGMKQSGCTFRSVDAASLT